MKKIQFFNKNYQGKVSKEVVLTCPSSFTIKQKDVVFFAAKLAEWKVVHFLPESIAALIASSYEFNIPNNAKVFLFDCGDGTTDICIAKIVDQNIEILSENGDSSLGGKEFEKILINYFADILKQKYEINIFKNNKKYRLMRKCREIKHALSVVEKTDVDSDDVIAITRQEFENMAEFLILSEENLIKETMRKSMLNCNDISIVFRCGGGCRMPAIDKMLKRMFPNAQHCCSTHPEELVAKGAALYAYELKTQKKII